jgi:hypothetical protein
VLAVAEAAETTGAEVFEVAFRRTGQERVRTVRTEPPTRLGVRRIGALGRQNRTDPAPESDSAKS